MEIYGTLVWYYFICKREVWLMWHQITPYQKDTNIEIGRFIHEHSYSRNKKEIQFGNVKLDVFMKDGENIVIGEIKKTSKFQTASKFQLLFYLSILDEVGIKARGLLLYPDEKKRVEVILDQSAKENLNIVISDIQQIISNEAPPPVIKINYCKSCGYREYCYA